MIVKFSRTGEFEEKEPESTIAFLKNLVKGLEEDKVIVESSHRHYFDPDKLTLELNLIGIKL